MDEKKLAREARERNAKIRLGTDTPRCAHCGRGESVGLEAHHVAGRAYDPTTDIECGYCHRILSDWQKDHPKRICGPPTFEEGLMHFLLGMADMFELLVKRLREFAETMLQKLQTKSELTP
ncbi:MAG: hypothetical protein ABIN69_10940 [Aestuariivirga sp.]